MDRFLIKQAAYLPFGMMLAVILWALFVPGYSSVVQHMSELQLLKHPIAPVTRIIPIVVGLSVMAFGVGVLLHTPRKDDSNHQREASRDARATQI